MGAGNQSQKCLHDGHRRIVMSNSIVITVPHRLGAKEAKRRIAEQIELLRRNYIDKLAYSEANWNGDMANLRVVAFGQTATAQVLDDALRALKCSSPGSLLPWPARSKAFSRATRRNRCGLGIPHQRPD